MNRKPAPRDPARFNLFGLLARLQLLAVMAGLPAAAAWAGAVPDSLARITRAAATPAKDSRFYLDFGVGVRASRRSSEQQVFGGQMFCLDLRGGGYMRPHVVIEGALGFAGASMARPAGFGEAPTPDGFIDWNGSSSLSFSSGSLGVRLIKARRSHEFFGGLAVGLESTSLEIRGTQYQYFLFIPIPTGTTSRSSSDLLPMLQLSGGLVFLPGNGAPSGKDRILGIHRPHNSRLTLETGYTIREDAQFSSFEMRAKGRGWFVRAAWGVTFLPKDAP